MRLLVATLVLAGAVLGADVLHLKNGRALRGRIVRENSKEVVLDVGGGTIHVARARIRLLERGADKTTAPRKITARDEWFLVLHRDKLVGWRRIVHTVRPDRVQVEERTVFFRPGGGDDVSIRRVETVDARGRPLDFMLMEAYGLRTELVSGQRARDGSFTVRVRGKDGVTRRKVKLPDDCTLALPAWSRFLQTAKRDEVRTISVLDPRSGRVSPVVLRRGADRAAPDGTVERELQATGAILRAKAAFRPGRGSRREEISGRTLVARRVSRERVDLARKAHAAPTPLSVEEALIFPFYTRPPSLEAIHASTGITVKAPDPAWMATRHDRLSGTVITFEKISIFGSFEVSSFAHEGASTSDCLARALTRLGLTATSLVPGKPERLMIAGLATRRVSFRARHRGEQLAGEIYVVRSARRYIVMVGAAPARFQRWARPDFKALAQSLRVAR